MKSAIKGILQKCAPEVYHAIASYRFFKQCQRDFGAFQDNFARTIYGDGKIHVLNGPFQGMQYYNRIVWGAIPPKWLGCYEEELHGVIAEIIQSGYRTIIDVGAAEGYYAVGLARACPMAQVYAFDIDPIARRRQHQLAELNGISNLHIGKYCSHESLNSLLQGHAVVICDIEGFEWTLLDPAITPMLTSVDILVEIHAFEDHPLADVAHGLSERFQSTHNITALQLQPRDPAAYQSTISQLKDLDLGVVQEACNEHRGQIQQWLWMKVK